MCEYKASPDQYFNDSFCKSFTGFITLPGNAKTLPETIFLKEVRLLVDAFKTLQKILLNRRWHKRTDTFRDTCIQTHPYTSAKPKISQHQTTHTLPPLSNNPSHCVDFALSPAFIWVVYLLFYSQWLGEAKCWQ